VLSRQVAQLVLEIVRPDGTRQPQDGSLVRAISLTELAVHVADDVGGAVGLNKAAGSCRRRRSTT
jgi:hypothetical protein